MQESFAQCSINLGCFLITNLKGVNLIKYLYQPNMEPTMSPVGEAGLPVSRETQTTDL